MGDLEGVLPSARREAVSRKEKELWGCKAPGTLRGKNSPRRADFSKR